MEHHHHVPSLHVYHACLPGMPARFVLFDMVCTCYTTRNDTQVKLAVYGFTKLAGMYGFT